MIGVEAGGLGLDTEKHGASISRGSPGVLHGQRSLFLQDSNGQILETHSVSAGLDYPGVGPEHAHLHSTGRVEYVSVTDDQALRAFHHLSHLEGIIPAMESSHALAYLEDLVPTIPDDSIIVVCLSGRGDKDIGIVSENKEGS
jgi:tryptophan synthase beta chain